MNSFYTLGSLLSSFAGRILGTIIGGYLIKQYGMIAVFQMASVFSAICAILYLSGYLLYKYCKAKRETKAAKQTSKTNGNISNGGNYVPLPVTSQNL